MSLSIQKYSGKGAKSVNICLHLAGIFSLHSKYVTSRFPNVRRGRGIPACVGGTDGECGSIMFLLSLVDSKLSRSGIVKVIS